LTARQKIFRVRRSYNQWVSNQTLEDYALRFTAKSARKWSLGRVANTALGAISFLALEAIGGAITLSYGFDNAVISISVVCLILFLAGTPICYYAAKYGVDIDLLTRGAGFGYIGSTVTSLIYASFTFIFFALEAAIMAMALKLMFSIPLSLGYLICSVAVIPLVTHGITLISRFQLWTQPLWVVLQLLPFCFILYHDASSISNWQQFEGLNTTVDTNVSLIYFGAASAVLFSLIAQIGEQVDFLRFLPTKTEKNRYRWWIALIAAGPGWVIVGALKLFAGSFLATLAINNGVNPAEAADPARMYIVAFNYVTNSPETALMIGGFFVILSQLKINVTNAYAGSIAWSNFFSRLTHNHPGRVVWLVFNVIIALTLMELGIYQTFEQTLGVYAIVAVAWVATLVADLVINKPLGLSPKDIEFKRAYLYDINPVGVGAMTIATASGMLCYFGTFGEIAQALAHFITIITALISAPTIAVITKSKYYIARQPDPNFGHSEPVTACVICLNEFENEDMALCPAYNGGICSLCCSLDVRCHDSCKETPTFVQAIATKLTQLFPSVLGRSFNHHLSQFIFLLLGIACVIGSVLILVYNNVAVEYSTFKFLLANTLWKVFFILAIVAGVVAWLIVLANKSLKVAETESNTQNQLLMEEIEAHKKTDLALQTARKHADSANNAKSRYVAGISHELRTPLNSILGYAQLLEQNKTIPQKEQHQLSVIRSSGEHLADLIEGLLDISKIEAGRLVLYRDKVNLSEVMRQLESMFRLQAESKGLTFKYVAPLDIPEFVSIDEKRLRQILINLLSNAVKFTQQGQVTLTLLYRNEVAKFEISDTGVGIPEDEMERMFMPFERIRRAGVPNIQGTGLGLTITKLLTDIMGGNLTLKNNTQDGLTTVVSLMLPKIFNSEKAVTQKLVTGYQGDRKVIVVVDDEPNHRGLIADCLMPLGFTVLEAHDSESCLSLFENCHPDLSFLDISMPEVNGWQLAEKLRNKGYLNPIIMVSASSGERIYANLPENRVDDFLVKPVKLDELTAKLGEHLNLTWEFDLNKTASITAATFDIEKHALPSHTVLSELLDLIKIGHLSGFNDRLKRLIIDQQGNKSKESHLEFLNFMDMLANNVELAMIKTTIEQSLKINRPQL
jgi:signal transduction histidine kinase/CheY-like chemotaxis protein